MWHTVEIKVPSHLIVLTKAGKPKLKPTLTKLGNLSRFAKQTSIKLIPEEVDHSAELAKLAKVITAKVEHDLGAGTYTIEYLVGDKSFKKFYKSDKINEVEPWIKNHVSQLRKDVKLWGKQNFPTLKIRII